MTEETPVAVEETVTETTGEVEEAKSEPITLDNIVDVDSDDDEEEERAPSFDFKAMRKLVQDEINKANLTDKEAKKTKEKLDDKSVTKEDLEALYARMMYKQDAERTVEISTEASLSYLSVVEEQIKKIGIDPKSIQGRALLNLSEKTFTNLALSERAKGKPFLTPRDVEKIKKQHWREMKPTIEGFAGKSTVAKPKIDEGSPAGAASAPSAPMKKSEFDKQMASYASRREAGTLSAGEVNEMQKLIKKMKG